MADQWSELEAELEIMRAKVEESAQGVKDSVQGGAGSPVEQRIAQALLDQAAANEGIEKAISLAMRDYEGMRAAIDDQNALIAEQNNLLRDASAALRDAREELGAQAYAATEKTLARQKRVLGLVENQAESVFAVLEKLDGRAAEKYEDAVEKSCKRLKTATMASAGVIAALSIIGGVCAAVGAFWVFSVSEPLQRLVADGGGVALFGILIGCAIAVWLIFCVKERRR